MPPPKGWGIVQMREVFGISAIVRWYRCAVGHTREVSPKSFQYLCTILMCGFPALIPRKFGAPGVCGFAGDWLGGTLA